MNEKLSLLKWTPRNVLALLIVAVLAMGSVVGAAAAVLQTESDAPSPAQGDAAVIAQGVTAMPADEVAWKVVRVSAPRPMDRPEDLSPGFILAEEDAIQVVDTASGYQTRLPAGEAAFVPSGALQIVYALADGPVDYYRIGLVPASEVDDDLGDEPVFAGEGFAAPGGNRDIDLVRDNLTEDEESELTLGSAEVPALLLATAGKIEIVYADDFDTEPIVLSAGEATTVSGDVTITATGSDGATFVAAVVGPEVPPIPTQETDTASVAVVALACPVAYEGTDYATDCTEPVSEVVLRLVIPATEFSLEATTGEDGTVLFEELGANTYALTGGVPAEFAIQTVVCANEAGPIQTEPTGSEIPGAVFDVASGDEIACSWYVIPEDLQGDSGIDADNDGLTAAQEAALGTSDDNPDSDEDGLFDGAEVAADGPGTDPALYDTDGDGYGDNQEVVTGSDPLDPESIPATGEPSVDTDGDNLTDAQEAEIGTDPNLADTDDDGLTDFAEVGFEPGSSTGTDPLDADTDDDGVNDGAELEAGTDPLDPADS